MCIRDSDKFAKLQKETKPYNPAKDRYQITRAEKSGKNPIQKKVALDKLSTQYRSRHTFRKGNPKFSRDVKSLNRQIDVGKEGGGPGTVGPHGTAVGTGSGYYGKGNKARRRLGLNVKEREYPTKLQKSGEDFGFKALSKKESIARSQRRKAKTPTMRDLQTKTFPQKGLSIDKAFDKFEKQSMKKLVDEPIKKIKKLQSDSSIKQIKKSKIHKMDLDQIKKNLGQKFKDSPD